MNILVAFGSQSGSTRHIAEHIGARLEQHGHIVTLQSVETLASLVSYDGVILGGGVYKGGLHQGVMRLARAKSADLAGKRTAAFSVSLSAAEADPAKRATAAGYVQPLATLLSTQHVATFPGAYDPQTVSPLARLVLKLIGARPGAFYDWAAVDAWADELAAAWAQ